MKMENIHIRIAQRARSPESTVKDEQPSPEVPIFVCSFRFALSTERVLFSFLVSLFISIHFAFGRGGRPALLLSIV